MGAQGGIRSAETHTRLLLTTPLSYLILETEILNVASIHGSSERPNRPKHFLNAQAH